MTQKKRITIEPITRLEGHGKIDIFINENGSVDKAYFQVPELRGFEVFCLGRPAEDMPQITSRICGVCPTAHHMAAARALDDLYEVTPPPTAKKIRELVYNAFQLEDHALHVYVLGGPDFIVGPHAAPGMRNILGVVETVGVEVGKRVITMRRRVREFIAALGGKVIHPVLGLPGGISKPMDPSRLSEFQTLADDAVDFALFTLETFRKIVLENKDYVNMITSDPYTHKSYYMGMVDENNKVNFYDGDVRIVNHQGEEFDRFAPRDYLDIISEHVETWSYVKFCYLKKIGWKGFVEGEDSGIYAVAPLARLNASDGMATEKAQEAYEEYFRTLGGKPIHHTLANHWARVIEMLYAAERIRELLHDPEITGKEVRTIPTATPGRGVGIVEAPRGTLIHDYETDENGMLTRINLIVATQNNAARMAMSVDKAARGVIKDGVVNDSILNEVEMAFRAYDPCHACASHTLPGQMPLIARVISPGGQIIQEIRR